MTPAELLAALQRTFPAGATSGTFAVAGVEQGAYAALFNRLGLPAVLNLTSSQGWLLADGVVSLEGTSTTPLLGVADAPVTFRFTPGDDTSVLLLDVGLPHAWVFGTSFPLLADSVFDDLALVDPVAEPARASALIVASASARDPLRTLDGAPLVVAAGLSFFGYFDPAGTALAAVAELLQGGGAGAVSGPVAHDAQTGVTTLDLDLATARVTGLFGPSGPEIDLSLALSCALDAAGTSYPIGIRFDTVLEFGTTDSPGRSVDLSALFTHSEQAVLDLTLSGSALAFPTPATLARYFGSDNGIAGALPDQFSGGSLVQVNAVTFGVALADPGLAYVFLSVGALEGQSWKLWPGVIEIGDLEFLFGAFEPLDASQRSLSFDFTGTLTLGGVAIEVKASLPGEVITGSLAPGEQPNLLPLLEHVFGFTPSLPEELLIATLDLSADIGQSVYSADLTIDGQIGFDFGYGEEVLFEELALSFGYASDGASGELTAVFAVGVNQFTVSLDISKGNTVFTGAWQDTGADPLTYQDLAIALGLYGLPNLPDGIDLSLTSAAFAFESDGPSFAFDLVTRSYGEGALVAGKDAAGSWGFVFGMILGLSLSLDLTTIPLVGTLVPQGDDLIALTDLRIVGATEALIPYVQTDALKRILGPSVNSGLVLSVDLQVGSGTAETFTVRFGGPNDGTGDDTPPESALPAPGRPLPALPGAAATAPGPQITWITVQRSFGPVTFDRIGFALSGSEALSVLLDAGVSIGGLSLGLSGLEATVPLHSPYLPSFDLAGLSAGYTGGELSIAGGLGKVPGASPPEYTGELSIVFGSFGATAVGSYTTVDGHPSLFAFLFVDAPLGGPAFFFVTGLAGGFGYNRSLRLPTIDQVAAYPLVRGAVGTLNPAETQAQLDQDITPTYNENWLAAGVRFTSFEMISSFALLTVSFGTSTEIALLGESTLTVPAVPAGGTAAPVAVADLVLLVDVQPAAGQFTVDARLTPRSYVLAPAAHLTGGFAFYLWFGDNPHAGDFVVTLGGYSPYYTKPAHYPTVPRLGLNWQVSPQLTVEGELYFALTPALLMAGGGLQAAWSSDGLNAWFDAATDFLVRFQPFSYAADLSVSIGASYTVDLGFTTKTITASVGVDLSLWGPPFGGTARVDLWVISFTITFGDQPPPPAQDLNWTQFSSAFLPAPGPAALGPTGLGPTGLGPAVPGAVPAPTVTDSLLVLGAPSGLLGRDGTAADSPWLVDPERLALTLTLQIPSKQARVTAGAVVPVGGAWSTAFGIGPMGLAPGAVSVALDVTIVRADEPDTWSAAALTASVPAALWLNTSATLGSPGLVENALTGLTLLPTPPAPQWTAPVPLPRLTSEAPPVRPLVWSTAPVPHTDPFDQTQAWTVLADTVGGTDQDVADARDALLAALRARGLSTASSVDTAGFATRVRDLLAAPPALRLLGEEPATPTTPGTEAGR